MIINRSIYFLLILSLLGWSRLEAQEGEANKISFDVKNFTQEGNLLRIDIDFDLTTLHLSTRDQLLLTPVIRNGNKELVLDPVLINGKIRNKVYERQKVFGTLSDNNSNSNTLEVVKSGKQKSQVIPYSTTVKFEEWMKGASLFLNESNCPGCGKAATQYQRLLTAKPTLEIQKSTTKDSPQPLFSFVLPPADVVKIGNKQGNAYLNFRVSQSTIDPSLGNNTNELNKIHATLEQLLNDKNITLKSISMTGFASIEGTYAFNNNLAEQRVKALYNYIQKRYNLPFHLLRVNWVGEDWDGLVKLIQDGNMDKKQEVLDIINQTDIFDGREKQLMDLDRGRPYLFMLDQYFPLLRRVSYIIEYGIIEYSLDESKNILNENPDQLSRRELFLLADSYGKGSPKFYEILDKALTLYPEDPITRQNAAAGYAMSGNYEKAEQLVLKSGNTNSALNNLGAIYLLEGKIEDARNMLQKAKQMGSQEALYNLNELNRVTKK